MKKEFLVCFLILLSLSTVSAIDQDYKKNLEIPKKDKEYEKDKFYMGATFSWIVPNLITPKTTGDPKSSKNVNFNKDLTGIGYSIGIEGNMPVSKELFATELTGSIYYKSYNVNGKYDFRDSLFSAYYTNFQCFNGSTHISRMQQYNSSCLNGSLSGRIYIFKGLYLSAGGGLDVFLTHKYTEEVEIIDPDKNIEFKKSLPDVNYTNNRKITTNYKNNYTPLLFDVFFSMGYLMKIEHLGLALSIGYRLSEGSISESKYYEPDKIGTGYINTTPTTFQGDLKEFIMGISIYYPI